MEEWDLKPNHIQEMKREKVWGGNPEIGAIVKALGIQVALNGSQGDYSYKLGDAGPVITVKYSGSHYDLVNTQKTSFFQKYFHKMIKPLVLSGFLTP